MRWKDSRWKHCILSCYQVNTLCATAGRGLLPLATKITWSWRGWGSEIAAGKDKEKGKGWWLRFKAEKDDVLQSSLPLLLQGLQGKLPCRRQAGIFFFHLLTLPDSSVTYVLQTNKRDGSHSCTNTWPRLTHFSTALPSPTSMYCFQWPTSPRASRLGSSHWPRNEEHCLERDHWCLCRSAGV